MTYNPDNPNEHAEAQNDPFASADTAKPMGRVIYGQIDVNAWWCALIKGQGKVPYDSSQHKRKATAVDLLVAPLADMNLSFNLERHMIAESREWAGIVWASAKALGATASRELNGKWCKCEQVPTGRKYRNSSGEEREATTIKFLAFYDDEGACRTAYHEETGKEIKEPEDKGPLPGFEAGGAGGKGSEPVNEKEKASAQQFLELIIKQYAGDMDRVNAWIPTVPVVSQYFEPGSQEVMDIASALLARV